MDPLVLFHCDDELCTDLVLDQGQLLPRNNNNYLPGHPLISLEDGEILPFVEKDILTPLLDQMSPWLWLLAAPMSTHVSPLHAQIVRGRNIVITEDPELHLVWISNRVFVKPIPTYLLSHAFWSYLVVRSRAASEHDRSRITLILQTCLGYMRTYVHLIQYESDLRIAQGENLIPPTLSLETWMSFIKFFKTMDDSRVSGRYNYGDLRLTRLNLWCKPLLRRWYFRKVIWQYAEHFAKYFAPLLFIFGLWSLVLGSMQVGLQARPHWGRFEDLSAGFSVASLVLVVAIGAFFLGGFCVLAGREVSFALGEQIRMRRQRSKTRVVRMFKPEAINGA